MGGAERIASYLINYLADKGHRIVLVNRVSGKDHYTVNRDVSRIVLPPLTASKSPISAYIKNNRLIRAYRKIIIREKPDVILAFMNTTNIRVLKAARGLGIPVIISERNYPPVNPLSKTWERLRRTWYTKADNLVCISKGIFEYFDYLDKSRKTIIPNPIDKMVLDKGMSFVKKGGRQRFITVGRLHRVKNFEFLISSFARVARELPQWDLYIIGEGEERNNLENMVRGFKLEDRIFLPGASNNVAEWYMFSQIFCLTSHTEGFGNVIVEAMAYGVPVISVDCPTGPGEIIRNSREGFLIQPNDEIAFSTTMVKLANNEELQEQMSIDAKKRAKDFSFENIMPLWEILMESYV